MKRTRGLVDAASDALAEKDGGETQTNGRSRRIGSLAGLLAAVAIGFALGVAFRRFLPGA